MGFGDSFLLLRGGREEELKEGEILLQRKKWYLSVREKNFNCKTLA